MHARELFVEFSLSSEFENQEDPFLIVEVAVKPQDILMSDRLRHE